jgi:hypothetical protein
MDFKQFFENETSKEHQASLGMIKDLNNINRAPSWKGYPTWDFGNGVYISLSNESRNIENDIVNYHESTPNIWYIENIQSINKGQGNANNALKILIEIAKKNGIILRLYPKRTEKHKQNLNDKQLKSWYQKFGFKQISPLYYEL